MFQTFSWTFFRRKIRPFLPLLYGMPWPIFNISSISDLESFRNAIFYYQKIRRKILRRLHYELTARRYAPPYFVGEKKTFRTYAPMG
jgi:hypothetical protein